MTNQRDYPRPLLWDTYLLGDQAIRPSPEAQIYSVVLEHENKVSGWDFFLFQHSLLLYYFEVFQVLILHTKKFQAIQFFMPKEKHIK